jgi:photosystem II stability/assembly factor-like uncharacterized protein
MTKAAPRARLSVELFEDRAMPSVSIPLNGFTWTQIGPTPITIGQEPGGAPSTGRVNAVAVDPQTGAAPDTVYIASDSGGIWRTVDGGKTWSPRTDQQEMYMQQIATVHRTGGNTVYAFDQLGELFTSTDGGTTFSLNSTPFGASEFGAVVNKLSVFVTDPTDQTKDILFAAVGTISALPPSSVPPGGTFPGTALGSGVWRSTDGGATWTNMVDSTAAPFTQNPLNPIPADSFSFTDVTFDPTNPNIVYAALGNTLGDPTNGVYKTSNALSATPVWSLLIGGSQFVPGETPGNIKIAISPTQPSVVFASLALRNDPQTGFAPLLGIFRTSDAGTNWTPVLLTNPNNPVADNNNFMSIFGDDDNMIVVSPTSSTDPNKQVVIVGGFGANNNNAGGGYANTVKVSINSGATWTDIGIGGNGIAVYPNVLNGQFDGNNRLIVATGGGVFRLNTVYTPTSAPAPVWESLNGVPGPNALGVVQFNGFALNPTDPNQAVGNISFSGDLAGNPGPSIHNALLFSDFAGAGNSAYGWQTVDSNLIDGNVGTGAVLYNPFNPSIVYRVTTGGAGIQTIRRSTDGGRTWAGSTNGFQAYPNVDNGALYIPPIAIDPSQPNRLFSGYNQVQVTDDNGATWGTSMQVTVTNAKTAIPALPSSGVTNAKGGVIGLTAIGVGRESGVDVSGQFVNGVSLFVGTEDDATRDPNNNNPTDTRALVGPQLFANLIPNNVFPWPPAGSNLNWNNHSWANITPTDSTGASLLLGNVEQILVDPSDNTTIYIYTDAGQVFRGTNFGLSFLADANKNINWIPSITWTDLTGNLPFSSTPSNRPQDLALDGQDNVLYVGTSAGVWKLSNPKGNFTGAPPVWTQVGLDPVTGLDTIPPLAPVSAISFNPTTGILAAATYGRGVYELQVRGLITGHVFTDTNGDGIFEANEPGTANVVIEVIDTTSNAIIASTTTDATGFYQFRSLKAGNYKIVALNNPVGAVQTTATSPTFNNFTEQSTGSADFGYFTLASVSGVAYNDLNDNGVQDAGEPGLAGVTIQLFNTLGTLIGQTTTATDGSWSFTGLTPAAIGGAPNPGGGTFRIRELVPAGFIETQPVGGIYVITPISGQIITGENFGNFKPSGGGGGGGTLPPPFLVTAGDFGSLPTVTARNPVTNQIELQFNAYNPAFRGGVRLATANFGGALPDIVTAAGPGGGPHVEVFDGTSGALVASFFAYAPTFTGGVFVATGDVNGDGVPDIITAPGMGGGPDIKVFDGAALATGNVVLDAEFFAYAANFTGGVTVASGDVDGDGFADVITGAGPGGGPHVEAWSGKALIGATASPALIRSFFAYAPTFTGGVYVAAADINRDGHADIITGPGVGGWPLLRVFDGASLPTASIHDGFPFPLNGGGQFQNTVTWTSGLRVAVTDFNQDGRPDIIVSGGSGQSPTVRIVDALTFNVLAQYTVYDPAFLGGIFVAGD